MNDADDLDLETLALTEMAEITTPVLSVMVDFNDLVSDHGEEKSFELIGKLKDLLA